MRCVRCGDGPLIYGYSGGNQTEKCTLCGYYAEKNICPDSRNRQLGLRVAKRKEKE